MINVWHEYAKREQGQHGPTDDTHHGHGRLQQRTDEVRAESQRYGHGTVDDNQHFEPQYASMVRDLSTPQWLYRNQMQNVFEVIKWVII